MNCTLYIYKLWFAKIITLSEGICKGIKNPTKTKSKLKPRMCSNQTVQQENKAFTEYSNDFISFINLSALL